MDENKIKIVDLLQVKEDGSPYISKLGILNQMFCVKTNDALQYLFRKYNNIEIHKADDDFARIIAWNKTDEKDYYRISVTQLLEFY